MAADAPRTWILTSSPDNHVATAERDFTVIGIKERNRARALQMEPGDRIVLYLTKVMSFAAAIRITGELYEDRSRIWPGKPGKVDAYPWRFATEPELVLEESSRLAAETVKDDLEHIRKWPPEHWKLAFQGQLRTISEGDAALLMDRMRAAAGVRVRAGASRLRAASGKLDRDQRFAALAALALLVAMFLPWYEKSVVVAGSKAFANDSISAFGAVSFVEAAIFLVSVGVLVLVLARAEGGTFHLPGGDGTVILAAGLWASALIFYRVFDRPDVSGDGGTVGIQWGFFVAFVAAGALAYAGARMRAAARPATPVREPRPSRRARTDDDAEVDWSDAPTTVAPRRDRPASQGDGGSPPDRAVRREDARVTVDDPPDVPLRPGEARSRD